MNYDDMSVEELILHFRNEYEEVYLTALEEDDYIWRTLTQKEYKEIAEFARDEQDANERICHLAVLYPRSNFATTGLAYLPEMLAPHILDESGYGRYRKEEPLLTIFRDQMQNQFDRQAEVLVNRAFPYITFEVMENWTKEKLLKNLSKAEWSLQFIDQKTHIQLLTDSEIKAIRAREAEENGEEEEIIEEPAFDLMGVAKELRKQGQDPMFVLRHLIEKEKEPYVVRPMIGGSLQTDTMLAGVDAWRQGGSFDGRYDTVREQVQKLSGR